MTAIAFFFEMLQNRTYSFSILLPFDHVIFLEITHFIMFENLEMRHFPFDAEPLRLGHFEEKARDTKKGSKMKSIDFGTF